MYILNIYMYIYLSITSYTYTIYRDIYRYIYTRLQLAERITRSCQRKIRAGWPVPPACEVSRPRGVSRRTSAGLHWRCG